MTDHLPSERSCPSAIAAELIEEEFRRADLRVERRGTSGRLTAEAALLMPIEPGLSETAIGIGMGDETAAALGACFEAYEHYLMPTYVRLATRLAPADTVIRQDALKREWVGAFLSARGLPSAQLGCIAYETPREPTPLLWPSALVWDGYADAPMRGDDVIYDSLQRYASRGGIAIGMGYHEAAIHAASEAIERHALGCFLARHLFHNDARAVQGISRSGMGAAALACWHDAETALGIELELLDIGSDIACPAVVARCPGRTVMGVHLLGVGCSMYPSLAVRHALCELVQRYRCVDTFAMAAAALRARRLGLVRFPRLLRCFEAAPVGMRPFRARLPDDPPIASLVDHLHWLRATVSRAGYTLWLRELYRSPLGVSLVSAVIPGMERFAVVLLGRVAVPRPPQEGTGPATSA